MPVKRDKEEMVRLRRMPEAISVQLAACILDVSTMTIRRWIKKGYIKAYRAGPQLIRIPRSEIVRMRDHRIPFVQAGDWPVYQRV